jgi:DNA-directed RNA polymerase subunit RPC12/RpoP
MGSGVSFDTGLGEETPQDRYFCHFCHRIFAWGNAERPMDSVCPYCNSSFLELVSRNERSSDPVAASHRTYSQLSLEQARRITNATAMLRLLETQLREELESLQHAFESANVSLDTRAAKGKLTHVMKGRLVTKPLSLDTICCQPSCPICSDDFVVDMEGLHLPCGHIFHRDCVMPWLEQKQNCPICRAEVSNVVPTVEELNCLSIEEIDAKLRELNVEEPDIKSKEKYFFCCFSCVFVV